MKNKILLVGLFLLITFSLTGCGGYKELNQLAIASAVGIDNVDDGYEIVVQVINTHKESSNSNDGINQPKFVTYDAKGITLLEAFRNIVLLAPRKLYSSHLQLLVISEEVARKGIKDIIDFFFRDPENRKHFIIIISKDAMASEVLEVLTPLENLNAKKIRDSLTADYKYFGVSEPITFEKMMDHYLNSNKQISLPGIEIIGNEAEGKEEDNIKTSKPKTTLSLTPLIVFKDDKMLDVLSKDESIALAFIKNRISTTAISYKCMDGNYVAVDISNTKTKVSAASNKSKVSIKIKSNGVLTENNCNINLEDKNAIEDLQNKVNEYIGSLIKTSIKSISDKYNSDAFGFLDLFYKKNPKYYKTIKDNWYENGLKDLEVDVKVSIELRTKGNALRGVGK